ncbi:MAG: hypothetical protein QOH76_3988 [Thermoleophilaceae bacterium]|jgi:uncharacterized protein YciI|nr:hypothetical protein [Thermoleophilaceae bacterium]
MAHFVLFYEYVPNIVERRAPHRRAHLELYRGWRENGRLVMGGAVGDPPHSALIVFDVETAAEVEEFAERDPYVTNGLVTARRVEPWAVVS